MVVTDRLVVANDAADDDDDMIIIHVDVQFVNFHPHAVACALGCR